MLKLETEEDLKALPDLRWRQDQDDCVIARTIKQRLRGDHLYFHGPGTLGIYFERTTKGACAYAGRWWMKHCRKVVEEPWGDFDGTILFRPEELEDIPKEFFKNPPKGIAKESYLQSLRNRQKAVPESPMVSRHHPA